MYFEFANVLVFALLGAAFVVGSLLLGRLLLRPASTDVGGKREIYECGEPTVGPAWLRFDIRFYTVALMFVVFDVEVALLFPWATVFRSFVEEGLGWLAFAEVAVFLLILVSGLAYVWARGDIDWTPKPGVSPRTTDFSRRPERAGRVVAPPRAPVSATSTPEARDA